MCDSETVIMIHELLSPVSSNVECSRTFLSQCEYNESHTHHTEFLLLQKYKHYYYVINLLVSTETFYHLVAVMCEHIGIVMFHSVLSTDFIHLIYRQVEWLKLIVCKPPSHITN